MKFTEIKPINQIESNLFVKHNVLALEDDCLIQKCVRCGQIIEDYTPKPNSFTICVSGNDNDFKKGLPSGDVYVNKSSNTGMRITQMAIEMGFCSIPKEFIDCTTVNS